MKDSTKNVSASVRARLLNLTRSTGRNFQELVIRYTVERFLSRLVESVHRERFVLKGAMLYIPWNLDDKRTTMDLDLLGFGSPDVAALTQVFKDVCVVETADDGLIFDEESIEANPIREEAVYDGVRVIVRAALGVMPIRLQVDVGFGDTVVPEPVFSQFPALLGSGGPVILSYSPESVIAEKFNAMVYLGMANSRMKDYFDIWMLSQNFIVEGEVLQEALVQTFSKRQTALPSDTPIGLSDEFVRNESKQLQWQGFVRRHGKEEKLPDFAEIVAVIREFLMPVVASSARTASVPGVWSPTCGWHERTGHKTT